MSTATKIRQHPLVRLMARYPATAFVVMAFGFGWTSLIPLAQNGFGVLPIELPLR